MRLFSSSLSGVPYVRIVTPITEGGGIFAQVRLDRYTEWGSAHEKYASHLVTLTGAVSHAHANSPRADLIAIGDPLCEVFTIDLDKHIKRDEEG